MKIALLGNMNNNNFVLMRYLRDNGIDAHLLLCTNDGRGLSNHFSPESDTFSIDKWSSYIHKTNISEDIISSFDFPISWVLSIRSFLRSIFSKNNSFFPPTSKSYLISLMSEYTHVIGSGITPALFQRIGRSLDIFYPYAIGVEYYGDPVINAKSNRSSYIGKSIFKRVKSIQKKGIQNTKFIINPERSISEKSFKEIGVQSHPIFIPLLYNKDIIPHKSQINHLSFISREIKNSSITFISHSRLLWKKPENISMNEWIGQNKNNDRMLRAYKKLIDSIQDIKPLLFLFEYGPDINNTKKLICELDLELYVHWLPKMDRKYILWIISQIDIGIGEFYDIPNILWGCTALEIMACGKPIIQSQDFSKKEFSNIFGKALPPIQSARSEDEILNTFIKLVESSEERERIGKESMKWFNENSGEELTKEWYSIIKNID